MKKAIGMFLGQYGDLVIQTPLIRQFKELNPDWNFTLMIAQKFSKIKPLFFENEFINDIVVVEGYDDFPTQNDNKYFSENRYDYIFNPMPSHVENDWYNKRHYVDEFALMQNLSPPTNKQCYLSRWFNLDAKYKKCITISGFPSHSGQLNKTLSIDKWNYIVKNIKSMGYKVIQIGGVSDLQIEGAEKPDLNFLEAAIALCSSDLHISADTCWNWVASAYQCKTIALYGINYHDMISPKSHFPVNPNHCHLWSQAVNEIEEEKILDRIEIKLNER